MNLEHVRTYLEKRSRPVPSGCVEWRGPVLNSGYGAAHVEGMKTTAHRVAFAAEHGDIPRGRELDHLCRNRICINAAHLEVVTRKQNMERTPVALATHCVRGHEFTSQNTRIKSNGCRACRTCQDMRNHGLLATGQVSP